MLMLHNINEERDYKSSTRVERVLWGILVRLSLSAESASHLAVFFLSQ